MKKIIFALSIFLLTGCFLSEDLTNTPTKQVEAMLSKYQTLDEDVIKNIDSVVNSKDELNDKQKEDYKKVLKRQYQNLTYEIKNETIDGEEALVEIEIEVFDYKTALDEIEEYRKNNEDKFNNNGAFDNSKFIDYKIEQLDKYKERVKYTLEIDLNKKDDKWIIDNLSSEEKSKIEGTYDGA